MPEEILKKEREGRFKKRVRKRNKIIRELEAQLGGDITEYHSELIQDYAFMWDAMQELKLDIKERGVSIYWQNGEFQHGYKKNDSVREMTTVSTQMLKILSELDLKPSETEVDDVNGTFQL